MVKKVFLSLLLSLGLISSISASVIIAASAPALSTPTGLSLAEIKMTGAELVMLQNNTGSTIADLSQYWLQSFNKVNPTAAGVSSSTQQLPSGSLLEGQTALLSDGGQTCGAAVTDNLSISLTDGSGYLQIIKNTITGGVLNQTVGDAVSWSSGVNATPGMITNVPSNSSAPKNAYYRINNPSPSPPFVWQKSEQDNSNNCQLNVVGSDPGTGPSNPGNQLLPGLPPPATIISFVVDSSGSGSGNGAGNNVGLKAPILNELLPNPAKPQTDAEDEYVEIYNPNSRSFDLYGYKIQTKSASSSSKRTYTFPNGTKIPAKSFAAYPSSNISVSLANGGAQVWLLDPNEGIIGKSDAYGKAEDGLAWALAEGKWYWTAKPTPNASNIIDGSGSGGGTGVSGSGTGTVEGLASPGGTGLQGSVPLSNSAKSASLHPAVLAIVGALALLYGLYEYRNDIGNFIDKRKRNRKARRANRAKAKGKRSSRTKK